MLVDDHDEIRELFAQVLASDPHMEVVGRAASGKEAVEAVSRRKPDIVVIDFVLPDISGATAIELISQESPATKVITVSGLSAPDAYQAAAAAGSAAWVRKTDAVKELRNVIREVHSGAELAQDSHAPVVGDIIVHYQPVYRLDTGGIVGLEALARWAHPNGQIVSPADFLPGAEIAGMVSDFDRRVCELAARQLGEWHVQYQTEPQRWVSVNLSALDLRRPDLPEWISNALQGSRIEPGCMVLEITEAALIEDEDQTVRRLERLRDLGVQIALDDFVGAKASLDFMRRFSFDVVKVEIGLTAQLPQSEEAIAVMRNIQDVASKVGFDVVAEGLERQDQVDALRGLGCEFGQGYLFSRPAPAAECEALLSESSG